MTNQLAIIRDTLGGEKALSKMSMAAGFEAKDEKGRAKAQACAASVFAEIQKTVGDPKRDLSVCTPESILQCAVDAMQYDVPIDGRQFAHLVKYGNKATFQIGYRAYLAKIKEHYPDADIAIDVVYDGDEVDLWKENGTTHYKIQPKKENLFRDGEAGLKGIVVAVTYTDNGRLIRKVNVVPKERIDRAKNAAKQDFIWKSDYIEKAKAAAIKATFKHFFAAMQGLQEIIRYDNEHHYDPNKRKISSHGGGSIVDNINMQIENNAAPVPENKPENDDIIEGEIIQEVPAEIFPGDLPDGVTMEEYKEIHG